MNPAVECTNIRTSGYDRKELRDVRIRDGVQVMELGAFAGCTALLRVSVPVSVAVIGPSAFAGCTALVDVQIPDSVTRIGEGDPPPR